MKERIEAAFAVRGVSGWKVVAFESVSSTMDAAGAVVLAPGERAAVFALEQSAGRGREGRPWSSERGSGVYVTYVAQLPAGTNPAGLSLAVGLAVKRTLEHLGVSAAVKWPNDVLAGDVGAERKIAGILVDLTSSGSAQRVSIGIGMNLEPQSLPESTSIAEASGRHVDCAEAAAILTSDVDAMLVRFVGDGFVAFVDEWNQSFCFSGSNVVVTTPSAEKRGTALGAAPDGALLLERDGVVESLYSGSLRRA